MTFDQLIGILKVPSIINIDTEKKTIIITTPIIKIGPFSYSQAKSFIEDTDMISNYLSESFVQRMVMWHDFNKEEVEWSKESIDEISRLSKSFREKIQLNGNEKDLILIDYLKALESESVLRSKEIAAAQKDEREQRDGMVPLDEIFYAHEQLEGILKTYRRNTYPMIKALNSVLPDNTLVKGQVKDKLEFGSAMLNLDIEDIKVEGLG